MGQPKFVFRNLEERGRLQFFYHSASSSLPVRDVLNEQRHGAKTEPYIEKQAENYCTPCFQSNIVGFLKSPEKYLFLFTTCRNEQLPKKYQGKRFIVGYIIKQKAIARSGKGKHWWAVQGKTRLYCFEEAYRLGNLIGRVRIRGPKKLDSKETARVLDHFDQRRDTSAQCLQELERLKKALRRTDRRCK